MNSVLAQANSSDGSTTLLTLGAFAWIAREIIGTWSRNRDSAFAKLTEKRWHVYSQIYAGLSRLQSLLELVVDPQPGDEEILKRVKTAGQFGDKLRTYFSRHRLFIDEQSASEFDTLWATLRSTLWAVMDYHGERSAHGFRECSQPRLEKLSEGKGAARQAVRIDIPALHRNLEKHFRRGLGIESLWSTVVASLKARFGKSKRRSVSV